MLKVSRKIPQYGPEGHYCNSLLLIFHQYFCTGALSELREEQNLAVRGAVIGGATLLGVIVGSVRGRRASRVLYGLVGGGAGVAVCYPQAGHEVEEVARKTVNVISGEGLLLLI